MERRALLVGMSGSFAILAGCTSGDEGTPEDPSGDNNTSEDSSEEAEVQDEEFPDTETLLDKHVSALGDLSFEATEYLNEGSPAGESQETEKTIRGSEAGMLLKGDDVARNISSEGPQRVWFTDHARISQATHTYYPQGVTPPVIDQSTVEEIIDLIAFEQVEVTDEEEPVVLFEATGPSESFPEDVDPRSIDGLVEIVAMEYIQAMVAEIEFATDATSDETQTVIYEYEVTDVDTAGVSSPDFVDNALRVEGYLTDDLSAVVLEHASGPTVEAGTRLTFQDATYIAVADRDGPSFPTEFTEGDTAYVYWEAEEEAAISIGQEPSSVAREIALPSESGERDVYLEEESGPGPERFTVQFDRQG